MKKIYFAIAISFFCVLILPLSLIKTSAINTGFSTQSINDDQQKKILNSLNLTLLKSEPTKRAIDCFDVREDGMLAIGTSSGTSKTISVYDCSNFQYGYSFESSGSFGVEWNGDSINVCLVRSDLIISVNSQGQIEEILEIPNTNENSYYWRNKISSPKKSIKTNQYFAKNDLGIFNFFASNYSQLVIIDADGSSTVIYDVNDVQLLKSILIFLAIILFAGMIALAIVKKILKSIRTR